MISYWLLTPTPSIPSSTILAGDIFPIDPLTHVVTHKRGLTVIGTHSTNWPGLSLGQTPAVQPNDGIYRIIYAKEHVMPGVIATIVGAHRNNTTGEITFDFSDGSGFSYGSWADVVAVADGIDANTDTPKKFAIARTVRESPDGSNLENQVGVMYAVDCSAQVPIAVSE